MYIMVKYNSHIIKYTDHNSTIVWLLKYTYTRVTDIPVKIRNIFISQKVPSCPLFLNVLGPSLFNKNVIFHTQNTYLMSTSAKCIVKPYLHVLIAYVPFWVSVLISDGFIKQNLSEPSPVLGNGDKGDHRMVLVFSANSDDFDWGMIGLPWAQWLSGLVRCVSTHRGRLGPSNCFQVSMTPVQRKKKRSHPGRFPLNFNLLVFSCHSNFPSVVNDESVEFRSTGGMWQFECPLERLWGQLELFKWGQICAL